MGFQLDAVLPPGIRAARDAARHYEDLGFDGVYAAETQSDPFVDLAAVAVETSRPLIGTNLAIAFARSPFVTAVTAWQLHAASGGRMVLGLGTQVKGHIERRFGMKWESPGPKFREYVEAIRALWDSFQTGAPPQFRGRFYTHTISTPFFKPPPLPHEHPKIWIAAVNEYNAETVGLVCDGILVHPVHSTKYLDEVLMPAIDRGLEQSKRTRDAITVQCLVFLVVGDDDAEREQAAAFVRSQIAFYGSTRTYRRIFETHGWDDVPPKLHELMSRGEFEAMAQTITDEMLDTFAITGNTDDVVDKVRARYSGIADRLYFYNAGMLPLGTGLVEECVRALR